LSDGLEAAQKAEELQPDLILLDLGLPGLNGIEAARQIRKCAPRSRILFVSENRTREVVDAALDTGALGYILKSDARMELLLALDAVLHGKRHVSAKVDSACSR
jgi:DNA-binding NarL/FixJ family response regulator